MKNSGFTLIEMVFALIVIGVVTSIAVPPMLAWQRNMALATSVDQFERLHELTRITAIREGRVAELHVDTLAGRFWVEIDTTGTNVRDTVAVIEELEEGVTFRADRELLCFDGRGLPTAVGPCEPANATLVFELAEHGEVDTTRITLLGKVVR